MFYPEDMDGSMRLEQALEEELDAAGIEEMKEEGATVLPPLTRAVRAWHEAGRPRLWIHAHTDVLWPHFAFVEQWDCSHIASPFGMLVPWTSGFSLVGWGLAMTRLLHCSGVSLGAEVSCTIAEPNLVQRPSLRPSALEALPAREVRALREQLQALAKRGDAITVGTACSGTDIIMVVLELLKNYWEQEIWDLTV